MFVPSGPFQLVECLWLRRRACPRVEHQKGASPGDCNSSFQTENADQNIKWQNKLVDFLASWRFVGWRFSSWPFLLVFVVYPVTSFENRFKKDFLWIHLYRKNKMNEIFCSSFLKKEKNAGAFTREGALSDIYLSLYGHIICSVALYNKRLTDMVWSGL